MLKWTRRRPTEPGWYWFRPTDETPQRASALELLIVQIDAVDKKLWFRLPHCCYLVDEVAGWFAGPLEPPDVK